MLRHQLISLTFSRLPIYTSAQAFTDEVTFALDLQHPGNHLDTFSVTYLLLRLSVLHHRMPLFRLVLSVSLDSIPV